MHNFGPGFLQSYYSVVEESLFLVFQPATCRADNVLVVRNFVSSHEFFQFRKNRSQARTTHLITRQLKLCMAAIKNDGFELLRHPPYSPFVFVLHGKRLAGRPRTTILLQRNQSFGEMLDYRCILVAGEYVKKSQNTICISRS